MPLPVATPPQSAELQGPIKTGEHLFDFNYQKVTELLVVKADPATGDRWAAHLTRVPGADANDATKWEIHNAGGGPIPLNVQADGFFILHLLDTVRTLQVDQAGLEDPQTSLGLAPPRYALQWRVEGKGYELRIGAAKAAEKDAYAWIPGQAPFVIGGATLQMLEYLKDFSSLRLKTWIGVTADDTDEVEIPGEPAFYAQRDGSDWTDRKHKSLHISGDFSAWLDRLAHQRVKEFIDDPAKATALRTQIEQAPLRKATLKDRHGHAVTLLLAQIDKRWYALSSARPQGVFEVFPESSQALEPPKHR